MPDPHAQDATRAEIEELFELLDQCPLWIKNTKTFAEWLHAHGVRLAAQPPGTPEQVARAEVEPLAAWESEATAFLAATGYLRPGKDVAAAMNVSDEYERERGIAWKAWCGGWKYAWMNGAPSSPAAPSGREAPEPEAEVYRTEEWDEHRDYPRPSPVAAPEPSAPGPGVAAYERLLRQLNNEQLAAEPSAPAPCPVREAAQCLTRDALGCSADGWRVTVHDHDFRRLQAALKEPCAGRAGAPRKEES